MIGKLSADIHDGSGYQGTVAVAFDRWDGPRAQYHWSVTSPDGEVIGEGSDLRSGATGTDGAPLDIHMLATLCGFLSAAAESYRYSMRPGVNLADTENGELFNLAVTEWAYGVSDELSLVTVELEGEDA